jgi:hypothetical protein
LIFSIARYVVGQPKLVSLSRVSAPSWAFCLIGKPVVKHRKALSAVSPVLLRFFGLGELIAMRQRKIVPLGIVTAARGTGTLGRKSVVKKGFAFVAKTPLALEVLVISKYVIYQGRHDERRNEKRRRPDQKISSCGVRHLNYSFFSLIV